MAASLETRAVSYKPALGRSPSMRLGLCEGGLLCGARVGLVLGLPVLVGHAVDDLAGALLGELQAPGVGRLLVPVGEAVAAEAGQIHHVDVLRVAAPAQMLHQLAEGCRLELGHELIVDLGHGPFSIRSRALARCTVPARPAFPVTTAGGRRLNVALRIVATMRQSRAAQAAWPAASRIRSWRISISALTSPRQVACCQRQSPSS